MAVCKQGCGLPVKWEKSAGRWKCLNMDGTDHWDRCSEARTKKVMAQGTPFKDSKGEGYIFEGKKKYFHMVATTHYGKVVKQRKSTST